MKTGTSKQAEFVDTEPGREVGCRLNAPAKARSGTHEALCNLYRSFEIDEEVVVHDPEHFQAIAVRQIESLFDNLFGGKRIPLPSVDPGVRAVGAIEGTRQAGGVHGP